MMYMMLGDGFRDRIGQCVSIIGECGFVCMYDGSCDCIFFLL